MWVNHWQTAVTAAVKVTLSCQVSALDTSDHDINTHCSSEPKHARVQRIKWTVLLTGSIQAGNWRAVTVKRNVALICSKGRSWKYAAALNIFHRLRDSQETSSTNDAKKMVLVFVTFHVVLHVAPPHFYRSPEQTNGTCPQNLSISLFVPLKQVKNQ